MIDEHLERAYNVRMVTPGSAEKVSALADRAEQARIRMAQAGITRSEERYGSGARETVDIFASTDAGNDAGARPCLMFIHGGYWRSLTKEDYAWVAEPYLAHGWVVAIVEYALVPDVTIAQITDQIGRAFAWITEPQHSARLKIAADGVTVVGHSAGGHLALAALVMDRSPGQSSTGVPQARQIVSISGLFDLAPLLHTSMNADLRLDAKAADALSPMHHVHTVPMPVCIAAGDQEPTGFIDQHNAFLNALAERDVPTVERIDLAGADNFDACDRLVDTDGELFKSITRHGWRATLA